MEEDPTNSADNVQPPQLDLKVTQFGPIEIEKALNLDGTEGLRRAPQPMKMGPSCTSGVVN
jgi:hypothetical protein